MDKGKIRELIRALKNWRTDWDGSDMKRGEPPRDGIHCDVLYDAGEALSALLEEVEEAEPEITPGMIEAGVDTAWGDPAPPAFIRDYVTKIYLEMERARRLEQMSGTSSRRQ